MISGVVQAVGRLRIRLQPGELVTKIRKLSLRFSYIHSLPLLLLWTICLSLGWLFEPVVGWISFLPLFVSLPIGWYFAPLTSKKPVTTASLAGFVWNRNDFCRGWLITGDTGAGKTFAINALMHSVFRHESDWGGLCCDEKGIYYETLVRMARKYNRQDDLLLLQTRPDYANEDWIPPARFNLLSDSTIPWSTYATVIVDTASSLGAGSEDKGFFKTQAHANIGRGIQLFRLLNVVPTMQHLLKRCFPERNRSKVHKNSTKFYCINRFFGRFTHPYARVSTRSKACAQSAPVRSS